MVDAKFEKEMVKKYLVRLPINSTTILEGNLTVPIQSKGIVLFAHGSGSSRFSPRNRFVAERLNRDGIGTLLIDLLTRSEEEIDTITRHLRFDISLLSDRLIAATDWLIKNPDTNKQSIGYFGASTGAAAALVAAAQPQYGDMVKAIVSRGGRPDLAGAENLSLVKAATLLIVGGDDLPVIEMNRKAFAQMNNTLAKKIEIIQGATHLFEEPGKLEEVAVLASKWFNKYLALI
jgi:putative phosphoribosyl transferase